jgi:CHAT domain-containing protein
MEGLAWAFLRAGAAQVLASRNYVEDEATCRLMQIFYRHLRDHPAAEALRRMREEGLRDPKIDPYEVGLWSLWS